MNFPIIKNHIFSDNEIDSILNLKEVKSAKKNLDTLNVVNFTLSLENHLVEKIKSNFGLDLFGVSHSIPMRWIKGDTESHKDKGINSFENTFLIYLTDSVGSLKIDNKLFPIKKGFGYIFNEGLTHSTENTQNTERLLIGPVSEKGFSVGSGFFIPGDSSLYFRQILGDTQYSYDNINWFSIGNNFPIYVGNSDISLGFAKIIFTTDMIFDDNLSLGINKYFICGSSHIQFGSDSLKNDGTRPVITVSVANYTGLIENGNELNTGQNNIRVYNLVVNATGQTLEDGAGWIGKRNFGNGATDNYIINCHSIGNLPNGAIGSGGIVGAYAAKGVGSTLFIEGCSSSGNLGQLSGGIVGAFAGEDGGNVSCQKCWTTGTIGPFSGGIFGDNAGSSSGIINAYSCYTTGNIGNNAGGIFGRYAGNNNGVITATNCYTSGNIDTDAGGIYGIGAGFNSGTTTANNCYSNGLVGSLSRGIYGTGKVNGTEISCYVANQNWNNVTAQTLLSGAPITGNIGINWVSTGLNTPYESRDMGYTPYSLNNIIVNPTNLTPTLKTFFIENINAGSISLSGIVSGVNYEILNPNAYFSIDLNSGVVSVNSSTPTGNYLLYIRNTGSYNISEFQLNITGGDIPCLTEETEVLTPCGYINITKLLQGDFIITDDGRRVQIVDIFSETVEPTKTTEPCIIYKNTLKSGVPNFDFRISQTHLIKINDKWILPKDHFQTIKSLNKINYYHIRLPNYKTDHLVINGGVVVESFGLGLENTIEYYKRLDKVVLFVVVDKNDLNK